MQIQILGTGSSSVFLSAWILAPEGMELWRAENGVCGGWQGEFVFCV